MFFNGNIVAFVTGPQVTALTAANSSLIVGATTVCTVTISAVQGNDVTVSLTSGNVAKITVPASVTVTAGNTTATFNATAVATGNTTISAGLNGSSITSSSITVTTTYNTTAYQTAAVTGKYPINGDATRFNTGYDDAIIVLWDNVGTSFYRVNQTSGAFTTHAFAASSAIPRAVNESGDVYYMISSGSKFYKQGPDDAARWFNHSASGEGLSEGANGCAQVQFETGPDILTTSGGSTRYWSSIDYTANTATLTNVTTGTGVFSEVAGQFPSIVGDTVFGICSGPRLGKVDSVTKACSNLTSSGTADGSGKPMIVDSSGFLYGMKSGVITKYTSAGASVASYDTTDSSAQLGCATDSGHIWAYHGTTGTAWWKVAVSGMTLTASGTLSQAHSANWKMAVGCRFLDQTSPVLIIDDGGGNIYLGKMVGA